MVIQFKCSGCGKGYQTRDDQAGAQIECPQCQTLLTIPQAGTGPSIAAKNRKNLFGEVAGTFLMIGVVLTGLVLLMGGVVFLVWPGDDADETSGENAVAASSTTTEAEPDPPVIDLIGTAPGSPPELQTVSGIAPTGEKTEPGFTRYAGGQQEIKLPGVMSDLVAGGRGRFLVLYLKKQQQIAIYDANEVKIVKTIPLETDDALIAAGADAFVIADRAAKKLERWSFASLEKESEAPYPGHFQLKDMALGYASQGPILLYFMNENDRQNRYLLQFYDLETLQTDPAYDRIRLTDVSSSGPLTFRASGDGTVFSITNSQDGNIRGLFNVKRKPLEPKIWRFNGDRQRFTEGKYFLPDMTGAVILSDTGPYSPEYRYRGDQPGEGRVVPSTHPNFYLSHPFEDTRVDIFLAESGEKIASSIIGPLGRLSDELDRIDRDPERRRVKDLLPLEKRVHYIYQSDQIVTVPFTDDALRIVPFSLVDALNKQQQPYLFATSVAPQSCVKGSKLDYQLEFQSSSPSVTVELSAAPEGMTLSETGRLTWQVPETFADTNVYVIITLYAEDQQMAFQVLPLVVQDQESG